MERPLAEYRCEGCRQGHYGMPDGTISNTPCKDEKCGCWFCGKPPMSSAELVDNDRVRKILDVIGAGADITNGDPIDDGTVTGTWGAWNA